LRAQHLDRPKPLFNPRVPFFRDYLSFVERFPENDAIYVVIQARDASTAQQNRRSRVDVDR
jgi:hypothetical protein